MIADSTSSQVMPYNTRRKSLSLPSLGIHLPVSHAERAAARLTPPTATTPNSEHPPTKKLKRSHEESPSMSPPKRDPIKYENTPPPSPEADVDDAEDDMKPKEIDLEGINDDIVEAVIIQLQKTGNRPHLVKELAAILSSQVKIVETYVAPPTKLPKKANVRRSANPSAIISSRLSSYLKRRWSALALVSAGEGNQRPYTHEEQNSTDDLPTSAYTRPGNTTPYRTTRHHLPTPIELRVKI